METISNETRATGNNVRALDVVAFVMHQPRLLQLLAGITSEDEPQFARIGYSEGVCVEAESLDAFLRGEGKELNPRLNPNVYVVD